MIKRASGILMHISSLPGEYGIGDFGKEAYNFVDFLEKSNQKNWQILPLGVTGFGDSPYQCFSAFAGNPYFIDLNELLIYNYLTEEDLKGFTFGIDLQNVDYGLLYKNKMPILRIAYNRAKSVLHRELKEFYSINSDWLREFSIFMSLKAKHNNKSWFKWDKPYRIFNSPEVLDFERNNQDEIYFWILLNTYS